MIAKKQIIYDSDFGQVFIVTRRTVRNVTMRVKEDGLHVTTPPYRSVKALLEVIAPFRERLLKLKSDVSPKPFGWDYTRMCRPSLSGGIIHWKENVSACGWNRAG